MAKHRVAFGIPENRGILNYLGQPKRLEASVSSARDRIECSPDEVHHSYYTLGTHPDLVARLWEELCIQLPEDCRWVVYGTPSLVRRNTGIIFGFCGGTHTYALRLPLVVREEAIAAGAKTIHEYPAYPELNISKSRLDLADIGPEWIFGSWLKNEENWCFAAYQYAVPFSAQ